MTLRHDRVEHHPVPAPRLPLVGKQVQPEDRAQELVLERLAVAVGAVVEHVVDVVGVPDGERAAPAGTPTKDIAALDPADDLPVHREALEQQLSGDRQTAEARRHDACVGLGLRCHSVRHVHRSLDRRARQDTISPIR
jgi:hypothetical protein